jgi:hypothetical protein
MARAAIGVGAASAGVLAYLLSSVNTFEAVVIPTILFGLVTFAVALYGRVRNRRQWSAAWEAYARRDVSSQPFEAVAAKRASSMVAPK